MTATKGVRRRRVATAGLTAALVAAGLLAAGCGSTASSATGGATGGSATPSATGGSATASPGTSASASAGGSATASTAADTIVINNFMFGPMSLTVAPGAVVTVRNEDSVTHTLTSTSSPVAFNTGDIQAGQSKTFTAPKKAGSYAYICSIHQFMTGTLVVR